ncbi:MAG: DUF11 domain-containing protein, partial [Thermoplasmata archaeon]
EIANPLSTPVNIGGWKIQARVLIFIGDRPRLRWVTVYTFPIGTTIGSFKTGYNYDYIMSVDISPYQYDGVQSIRLVNRAGVQIDSVSLPYWGWSDQLERYKHEDNGIPIDTNLASDFYSDGTTTRNAPNDRKAPNIVVEKIADVAETQPGGLITYTIYYNNTGDGNAKDVWINDTLPDGATFVSSSIPPTAVIGNTYCWYFAKILKNTNNALTITVQVNDSVPNGTILTNNVNLEYKDQLLRQMPPSSASATTTVVAENSNLLPGLGVLTIVAANMIRMQKKKGKWRWNNDKETGN